MKIFAPTSHRFFIGIFFFALLVIAIDLSTTTIMTVSALHQQSTTTTVFTSRRRSSIKAIIFDMDGTLLDTETLSDKAILLAFGKQAALPKSVLEQEPMSHWRIPWEAKRPTLGLGGNDWIPLMLDYAQQHWGVTKSSCPTVEQFWGNWESGLNDLCNEIEACPGATELIQEFAKLRLPMAIATSSQYAAVEKKRTRHDAIFQHIEHIVARDDPVIQNGKPAPDLYLEAARRLGVDPTECLVFEDALAGVQSGKAAGCAVVAIPDARFSSAEKETFAEQADVVVDTLWDFQGEPLFGLNVDMSIVRAKHAHSVKAYSK